jgi:hypothetical protein
MKPKEQNPFPEGWDETRVREVIDYYENQTEEEAIAEDEAAFEEVMKTPSHPLDTDPAAR